MSLTPSYVIIVVLQLTVLNHLVIFILHVETRFHSQTLPTLGIVYIPQLGPFSAVSTLIAAIEC